MQPAETPEGTGVLRPTMMRPAPPRSTAQVIAGLAMVVPAFVLLIISYLGPLIWTVNTSFHKLNGFRATQSGGDKGPFTGASYSRAWDAGLGHSLGYALSLAIVPIVVVVVAAPVLAWAAHTGGLVARWVTRGLLALPLAAYAPTALAAAHLVDAKVRFNDRNLDGFTRGAYWWGTFGLFAAIGVTLFLATLRRRDPGRRPYAAAIVAGVIALAAVLAAVLQEFVYPWVISGRHLTPTAYMFEVGFTQFNFGSAAAASTLMLAPLLLLGVGVTLVIVRSGLRLEFDAPWRSADERTNPVRVRTIGLAVGGVALLVVLALAVIGLWPLLLHLGGGSAPSAASGATIAVNTWVPPLISTLVGVLVAALAATGISWLRPFGRHSEWLLLPFGLFLFVGIGPLALRAYANGSVAGRLNSFIGLIPPVWVALPALFVLALMLRGQALRGEALRQEGRPVSAGRLLLPVLPMVGVVFVVTWVVQAQDLLWPLISAADRAHDTGSAALLRAAVDSGYTGDRGLPYSLALPIAVFVLLFLVAVAVQLTYLDRVALRTGLAERDGPPRT
jgi:ABC-type sugar transport system permease subunit